MWQKFKELKKQLGFTNTLLYLFNRLFSPVRVIKYYFLSQLFSQEPLLPERRGRNIKVIEIPETKGTNPCPRPSNVIIERYSQSATCLAAFRNESFAGCLWYVKEKYHEDEVNCLFEFDSNDSVWDFDVYVTPELRLSPVFLKLWDEFSARLIKEGYHYSLSRISALNVGSLYSHKRMGAQQIGWATFICIGRFQITISNVSPFLHFSSGKASFPVFKLKPST